MAVAGLVGSRKAGDRPETAGEGHIGDACVGLAQERELAAIEDCPPNSHLFYCGVLSNKCDFDPTQYAPAAVTVKSKARLPMAAFSWPGLSFPNN